MTLPELVRGAVPSGRHVRRVTEDIQGARTGRGFGDVVTDLWYAVTCVVLLAVTAYGTAAVVQEAAVAAAPDADPIGEAGAVLVLVAVCGGVLALGTRLGPVALGGGGAGWWLPMPVDRRGLLRPSVLRWPAIALATGVVAGPLAALSLGLPPAVGPVLAWAALGGGVAALVGAVGAVVQQRPVDARDRRRRERVLAGAGDGVVAAAVVGLALLVLVGGWEGWHLHRSAWVALPLLVAAAGLTVIAERGVERLDGATLRRLGSLGQRAQVAVLALDLRELGRALTSVDARDRRRSWPLRARGPRSAVAVADLTLLARSPRALVQVTMLVLVAVVAARTPVVGTGIALYPVLLLTGFWAASSAAAGARHGELVPALDRSLPLSARQVRVARGAAPLVAAAVWSAVAVATVPGLAAVAPVWAVVLAAAAVRSAYRPPPKFRQPVVSSPLGGAPPTTGMTQGVDVALLGTLPTALALYVGAMSPTLLAVQWGVAAAVLAVVVGVTGRRPSA